MTKYVLETSLWGALTALLLFSMNARHSNLVVAPLVAVSFLAQTRQNRAMEDKSALSMAGNSFRRVFERTENSCQRSPDPASDRPGSPFTSGDRADRLVAA
jgi:hypothetical protein